MRAGGLLRQADFVRLWAGQTVSLLGSHITGSGLPLLAVITLGASPAQMGVLAAFGSAPVIFFSLVAGVWADRRARRPVMIAADLGRALVLATIPLAAVWGALRVWQVYGVMAIAGTLSVFFQVAYRSYLPSLVTRERLVEANSRLALSESIAEVIGPGLAGALVQAITAPMAILFDALSFLLSALSLYRIRRGEALPAKSAPGESAWKEARAGIGLVLRHPVLRAMAGQAAFENFFGGFIGVLYALYGIRVLHLTAFEIGLTVGAGGLSSLAGSFAAGRLAQRFGVGRTMTASLFTGVALTVLIPLAASAVRWGLLLLLLAQSTDIAYTTFQIHAISLRQSVAPAEALGRVNASMDLIAGGVAPLGALTGGLLGDWIGVQATLFAAVGGLFLGFLWIFFSPIRKMEQLESST